MPQPDYLLSALVNYAARGWPVFMLGRATKRPIANCQRCRGGAHQPKDCRCGTVTCHGFYAASVDPQRVAAMVAAVPRGQPAIRTGAISGLVVVDVDPANGGWESFARLRAAGMVPPTANVVTGSGGRHLYYRHPGGHVRSRGLPGFPGVDIKADGGYVVAPPAIHPRTGQPYRWAGGRAEVGEMPPALVAACLAESERDRVRLPAAPISPARIRAAGGISHPDRLLAAHLEAVRRAPVGKRRTTLYGAARGVARMVAAGAISPTDAVAALTEVGRQAEQTDRDIRAAIAGGFRDEGVAA